MSFFFAPLLVQWLETARQCHLRTLGCLLDQPWFEYKDQVAPCFFHLFPFAASLLAFGWRLPVPVQSGSPLHRSWSLLWPRENIQCFINGQIVLHKLLLRIISKSGCDMILREQETLSLSLQSAYFYCSYSSLYSY